MSLDSVPETDERTDEGKQEEEGRYAGRKSYKLVVDLLNEYTDNTRKGRVRGRVIDLGIKQEAHDAHAIQKNVKVFSKQETLVIRISL